MDQSVPTPTTTPQYDLARVNALVELACAQTTTTTTNWGDLKGYLAEIVHNLERTPVQDLSFFITTCKLPACLEYLLSTIVPSSGLELLSESSAQQDAADKNLSLQSAGQCDGLFVDRASSWTHSPGLFEQGCLMKSFESSLAVQNFGASLLESNSLLSGRRIAEQSVVDLITVLLGYLVWSCNSLVSKSTGLELTLISIANACLQQVHPPLFDAGLHLTTAISLLLTAGTPTTVWAKLLATLMDPHVAPVAHFRSLRRIIIAQLAADDDISFMLLCTTPKYVEVLQHSLQQAESESLVSAMSTLAVHAKHRSSRDFICSNDCMRASLFRALLNGSDSISALARQIILQIADGTQQRLRLQALSPFDALVRAAFDTSRPAVRRIHCIDVVCGVLEGPAPESNQRVDAAVCLPSQLSSDIPQNSSIPIAHEVTYASDFDAALRLASGLQALTGCMIRSLSRPCSPWQHELVLLLKAFLFNDTILQHSLFLDPVFDASNLDDLCRLLRLRICQVVDDFVQTSLDSILKVCLVDLARPECIQDPHNRKPRTKVLAMIACSIKLHPAHSTVLPTCISVLELLMEATTRHGRYGSFAFYGLGSSVASSPSAVNETPQPHSPFGSLFTKNYSSTHTHDFLNQHQQHLQGHAQKYAQPIIDINDDFDDDSVERLAIQTAIHAQLRFCIIDAICNPSVTGMTDPDPVSAMISSRDVVPAWFFEFLSALAQHWELCSEAIDIDDLITALALLIVKRISTYQALDSLSMFCSFEPVKAVVWQSDLMMYLVQLMKIDDYSTKTIVGTILSDLFAIRSFPLLLARQVLESALHLTLQAPTSLSATQVTLTKAVNHATDLPHFGSIGWLTCRGSADQSVTIPIPDSFEELSSLRFCQYTHARLVVVPQNIMLCKQLVALDLSHNNLSTFVPFLSPTLIYVNLSHNHLNKLDFNRPVAKSNIPTSGGKAAARLQKLSSQGPASAQSQQHQAPPQSFALSVLILSHNQFTEVPACIFDMENLTELDLSSNRLLSLPSDDWERLSHLNSLSLAHNNLDRLPAQIRQLHSLQHLDISHNHSLAALPPELIDLANQLTEFDCTGCSCLEYIPKESQHKRPGDLLRDIILFWEESACTPWHRCKLLILGHENAGKTSLAMALSQLEITALFFNGRKSKPCLLKLSGQVLYIFASSAPETQYLESKATSNVKKKDKKQSLFKRITQSHSSKTKARGYDQLQELLTQPLFFHDECVAQRVPDTTRMVLTTYTHPLKHSKKQAITTSIDFYTAEDCSMWVSELNWLIKREKHAFRRPAFTTHTWTGHIHKQFLDNNSGGAKEQFKLTALERQRSLLNLTENSGRRLTSKRSIARIPEEIDAASSFPTSSTLLASSRGPQLLFDNQLSVSTSTDDFFDELETDLLEAPFLELHRMTSEALPHELQSAAEVQEMLALELVDFDSSIISEESAEATTLPTTNTQPSPPRSQPTPTSSSLKRPSLGMFKRSSASAMLRMTRGKPSFRLTSSQKMQLLHTMVTSERERAHFRQGSETFGPQHRGASGKVVRPSLVEIQASCKKVLGHNTPQELPSVAAATATTSLASSAVTTEIHIQKSHQASIQRSNALLIPSSSKTTPSLSAPETERSALHRDEIPIEFTVWDIAASETDSFSHRLCFTTRAVYAILWDMRDKDRSLRSVKAWLTSLLLHVIPRVSQPRETNGRGRRTASPTTSPLQQPVIGIVIVGTHLDVLKREYPSQEAQQAMQAVRRTEVEKIIRECGLDSLPSVRVKICEVSLRNECNTDFSLTRNFHDEEQGVDELRETICDLACSMPCISEYVTGLHVEMDRLLSSLRVDHTVVTFKEIESRLADMLHQAGFDPAERIQSVLDRLTEWGICLALPGVPAVIVNPDWLIHDVMLPLSTRGHARSHEPYTGKYVHEVAGVFYKTTLLALISNRCSDPRLQHHVLEILSSPKLSFLLWLRSNWRVSTTAQAVIPTLLPSHIETPLDVSLFDHSSWARRPKANNVEVVRRFALRTAHEVSRGMTVDLKRSFGASLAVWLQKTCTPNSTGASTLTPSTSSSSLGKHRISSAADLLADRLQIKCWTWNDRFDITITTSERVRALLVVEQEHVQLVVRATFEDTNDVDAFLFMLRNCCEIMRDFFKQYFATGTMVDELAVCYRCAQQAAHRAHPSMWVVRTPRTTYGDENTSRMVILNDDGNQCPPASLTCVHSPGILLDAELLLGTAGIPRPAHRIQQAFGVALPFLLG